MAFIEAERVEIRRYLGFSRMYLQTDPRLESAITTAQSAADGGAAPDSSTEALIRATLTDLGTLENSLKALWPQAQALAAGSLRLDVARAAAMLRAEGRRLVGVIADQLEIAPRRDVFAPKPVHGHALAHYGR